VANNPDVESKECFRVEYHVIIILYKFFFKCQIATKLRRASKRRRGEGKTKFDEDEYLLKNKQKHSVLPSSLLFLN